MGRDIHGFIEYNKGKGFEDFGEVELERNYGLFDILTGKIKRNDQVFFQVKGLPFDISYQVNCESYNGCGSFHTFSYITLEEFVEYIEPFDINYFKDVDRISILLLWSIVLQLYSVKGWYKIENNKNIRFVFWFDN